MRRFLIGFGLLAAAFVVWFVFKSYTMPIWTENGIAELEAVNVNGDRQYVLIRGDDRNAPILFFLHGGPGMSAMYLGYAFQRPLEKDFVVVQWDQRGAGKSFHADIDLSTLRTSQLISDAEKVIAHVQSKLGKKKVFLVGHSHGSFLGAILASRRPDLIEAYVGVGQMADDPKPVQDEFLRGKLRELGLPEKTQIDGRNREDLLFATHSEIAGATSPLPLILTGLFATEYSLFDGLHVAKGPQLYANHMNYDVVSESQINTIAEFSMPVYFVMGRSDMVTPASQARAYFDKISAPRKRWYEFEHSGHFPFFEEPIRFASVMHEIKTESLGGRR